MRCTREDMEEMATAGEPQELPLRRKPAKVKTKSGSSCCCLSPRVFSRPSAGWYVCG